jgi:hypothetical protein
MNYYRPKKTQINLLYDSLFIWNAKDEEHQLYVAQSTSHDVKNRFFVDFSFQIGQQSFDVDQCGTRLVKRDQSGVDAALIAFQVIHCLPRIVMREACWLFPRRPESLRLLPPIE